MRVIKLFLISVVLLFLVVTGISLLLPSKIRVSRATDIQATASTVRQWVVDSSKWSAWYPGYDSLPTQDNAPHILLLSQAADSVAMAFEKNGRQPVKTVWKFIEHEGGQKSTVQWYMDISLRWYPWEKLTSLFLEKAYGSQMERGLQQLKRVAEQRQPADSLPG